MNCNHTTTRRRKPQAAYTPHFGNLLNEFFNTAVGDVVTKEQKRFTNPAFNVRTFDNRFSLDVALPGFAKEDVDLSVDGDLLKISAKDKETAEDTSNYRLREFNYAGFSKVFRLPETVDTQKIYAQYLNGVLSITLPKKEEAIPQPPKSITIL